MSRWGGVAATDLTHDGTCQIAGLSRTMDCAQAHSNKRFTSKSPLTRLDRSGTMNTGMSFHEDRQHSHKKGNLT
jgi:hypothetical protein